MLRVLRLSAVTALALAATVLGASAAGAAAHHKPGNCSVTKKPVTAGNYHAVAVTVVCSDHGAVSRSTMLSPDGNVTVSHHGDVTIVRDSAGNVSEVSADGSSSQDNEVSGGSNYGQAVGSDGSAVSSRYAAAVERALWHEFGDVHLLLP